MIYILISAIAGAVLFGILHITSLSREIEELKTLYEFKLQLRHGLLNTTDAEIAYLETLYGVDDHVRGKRENNKSEDMEEWVRNT